jgi:hypothetical protein
VEDARSQQMVIMWCVGCNLSLKEIKECVQFYLHEFCKFVRLLMRGFLEITFTKEIRIMATRKLVTIKWNGFSFFLQMDHAFHRFIIGGKTIIDTYDQNTIL